MKVCFETFGCRLNRAEALQMEAEYLAKGWELTSKHSDADLFVVRGCSVTRRAEHDCLKLIEHLKRKYPNKPIRICGCIKNENKTSRALQTSSQTSQTSLAIPTRTARAYLKVQDGCSGKCTFCIVPKFRGKSVSVPFTEVLDKAKSFIDVGYHEIVITGCNLSLYASEGKRFPDLIAALSEIGGETTRFRIGSLEPGACASETVDVMAERANICRFLHIPVQSGSNRILAAMRRPYLVKDITALVDKINEKLPLLGLGCDIITGFPGETEIDFIQTKGLLERLPFSNAHIFPFSARPGTGAATMPNQVSREVSHATAHELSRIARKQRETFAAKFLGRDVEIIVEDEKMLSGWTSEYIACQITNKAHCTAKRKDLVRVRVTEASHGELKALAI